LENMPTDQQQPDETGAKTVALDLPKVRKALSRMSRELTEPELRSTGVHKMLVEELERAEAEIGDLKKFRQQFHSADKELAVATHRLRNWGSMDVMSTGCIAVGAAALVYAPEAWKCQPNGWIAVVFGAVLTLTGIVAKAIRL
jgi:hypothetical protein